MEDTLQDALKAQYSLFLQRKAVERLCNTSYKMTSCYIYCPPVDTLYVSTSCYVYLLSSNDTLCVNTSCYIYCPPVTHSVLVPAAIFIVLQ